MQRQRLVLIIGVVLALIAVFLIKIYLDQQRLIAEEMARRKYAKSQENQVAVLFAEADIPPGTIIDSDTAFEVKIIPAQTVPAGAVTSLDRISGMLVTVPISKDEPVTLSKLAQQRSATNLASVTPIGKRAISINVDDIASLGGMIKPRDYVDVIAMIPTAVQAPDGKTTTQATVMPLFQNVLVLAVGQEIGSPALEQQARYKGKTREAEAAGLITLALTPQEANFIAFVQEQGKIRFVLRSPADAKVESIQPASWDTLSQYLMPPSLQPGQGKQVEPEAESYVEIYRGLNKERILLNK